MVAVREILPEVYVVALNGEEVAELRRCAKPDESFESRLAYLIRKGLIYDRDASGGRCP